MIVELSLMKRISKKAGVTDGLAMRYDGNRLKGITDEYGNSNQYNVKEFHSADQYNTNDKFIYDANGNMVRDFDRNIVTIRYNCLNLPDTIQFANGNQILNHYDATGMKYCTDYITPYTNMTTPVPVDSTCQWTFGEEDMDWSGKWYLGSRQYSFYKDLGVGTVCSLDRVQNPYGYHKGSNYYYYLKDHLGNVREVWYDAQLVVPRPPKSPYLPDATVQRTQYYAHGLPYAEGTGISTQPNKYNGKEFIEMHGYDEYDLGFRSYYPALGRFTVIDALSELHFDVSPYAYCMNNPINYVDPWGLDTISSDDLNEEWHTFDTENDVVSLPEIGINLNNGNFCWFNSFTNIAGTAMASIAGNKYTERLWGDGYFTTASGKIYDLDILNPQVNGKYVRGVQGLRIAKLNAQMSVRLLTRTGNLLGYWSVIMTGKDFIDNQNLSTGIDLATSIGSVLFWEFGAACGIGTLLIEGAKNEV